MKEKMAECYVKNSEKDSYGHFLDKPEDYEKENVNLFLGGSGLLSTIFDYFKFTKIISNNGMYNKTKIISSHGIQKLTTNVLACDIATIGPKTSHLCQLQEWVMAWRKCNNRSSRKF